MGIDSASAQQTSRNRSRRLSWRTAGRSGDAEQCAAVSAGGRRRLPDAGGHRSAQAAINSLSGRHASGNAVLFNALDYQTRLLNNRIDDASEQGRFGFWLESGQLRGSLDQTAISATAIATP